MTTYFPVAIKKQDTTAVAESIEKADGFAQMFPEHKFHIMDVLQKRGHIVGMTGDGLGHSSFGIMHLCGFL